MEGTPHLSGNSSQASYIYLNLGPLRTPHPIQISNPFCGGSRDFFLKLLNKTK